ncbi:MAG: N-alpha-acetyl-L-2,4-diaminobutyric acid deacetylase [Chloroflexi bacterium]|nr:N-alpha-acetyl-L-2,4-diaminobutyric acid deacetylase [Chloroflexota bacterium]
MSLEKSPISTDVNFEKEGKQFSYLRVPYSRNDSAWGGVFVPVVVVKNGKGPTVLFVGGNHGGEYEGSVTLLKLSRTLEADQIQGRVILLPALNLPAVQAGERVSPIDGRDMNRTFPGKHNGTISQIIAHYVHEAILPLCDAVIDLHSGGYSLDLMPYNSMHYLPDEELRKRTMAALKAFDAPVSLVMREFTGEGLLDYAVEGMGKIFLCAEIGGRGVLSPSKLKIAERGVQNMLKHFNLIKGDLAKPTTRLMEVPETGNYAYAQSNGIYEAFFEIGEEVPAGQPVGQVHYPESPEREPEVLTIGRGGVLVGTRGPGFVERGDCVAVTAQDLE